MSNTNTIVGFIGGTKRGQIQPLTLTAVTETAFPLTTDTGTTAAVIAIPLQTAVLGSSNGLGPNSNPAILVPPGGSLQSIPDGINAPYFNSSSFDVSRPFNVRIIGTAASLVGTTNGPTLKLYQGTAGSVLGGTAFATQAIASATTANIRFYLNVACYWDSVSQVLAGVLSGNYTVAGTTTVIANTALTSVTALTSPAALSFVPSVTWGNAVGGTLTVAELSIEQI